MAKADEPQKRKRPASPLAFQDAEVDARRYRRISEVLSDCNSDAMPVERIHSGLPVLPEKQKVEGALAAPFSGAEAPGNRGASEDSEYKSYEAEYFPAGAPPRGGPTSRGVKTGRADSLQLPVRQVAATTPRSQSEYYGTDVLAATTRCPPVSNGPRARQLGAPGISSSLSFSALQQQMTLLMQDEQALLSELRSMRRDYDARVQALTSAQAAVPLLATRPVSALPLHKPAIFTSEAPKHSLHPQQLQPQPPPQLQIYSRDVAGAVQIRGGLLPAAAAQPPSTSRPEGPPAAAANPNASRPSNLNLLDLAAAAPTVPTASAGQLPSAQSAGVNTTAGRPPRPGPGTSGALSQRQMPPPPPPGTAAAAAAAAAAATSVLARAAASTAASVQPTLSPPSQQDAWPRNAPAAAAAAAAAAPPPPPLPSQSYPVAAAGRLGSKAPPLRPEAPASALPTAPTAAARIPTLRGAPAPPVPRGTVTAAASNASNGAPGTLLSALPYPDEVAALGALTGLPDGELVRQLLIAQLLQQQQQGQARAQGQGQGQAGRGQTG